MRLFLICVVVWVFASCQVLQAERGQSVERAGHNKYIDALVAAKDLRVTYVSDGVSDASVLSFPVPEVRDVLTLGSDAVPLLIEHLDDTRLTAAIFNGHEEGNKPVSVGHVCLDILIGSVDAPVAEIEDCADDGLGACVEEGFYFRPDETSLKEMEEVKVNWQRAYRDGKVKFAYPAWLR